MEPAAERQGPSSHRRWLNLADQRLTGPTFDGIPQSQVHVSFLRRLKVQRINKYSRLGAIVERPCIKLEIVPERRHSRPSLINVASPGSNQSADYLNGGGGGAGG